MRAAARSASAKSAATERIAEHLPERPRREIGRARNEGHGFPFRQADAPATPWPQAGNSPEEQGLSRARIAGDHDPLADTYVDMRVGKLGAAGRRRDLDLVEGHVACLGFGKRNALFDIVQFIDLEQRRAEGRDTQQRCPPIGDAADIVDEPAQCGMHLVERANCHHQPTEAHVAGEIDRRRDHDRRHHGDPSIAGSDPGQPDHRIDDAAARLQHGSKVELEPASLVRLAGGQRNRVDMLVDAHQRKPQFGLARVEIAIQPDQWAADQPAHPRRGPGIDHGRPHHVARDHEIPPRDMEDKA